MPAIVGAGFPRPMGWGTQPLWIPPFRFPVSRLPYDAATCRPSGALVIWCMPPVYKHAAPLGLNAAQFSVRHPSQGLGFLARWVGEPNRYGFNGAVASWFFSVFPFPVIRIQTLRHVAPLGLWLLGHAVCYKHAAPLGLKADAATCRPVGALVTRACRPMVGEPAPLGLWLFGVCRPGSINMSPLWG